MPQKQHSTNVHKDRVALFHVVVRPKYRRPLLKEGDVAQACEGLMRYIASKHSIRMHAIAVQPDHVHIFMDIPRHLSIAYCVQQIKWFSSLRLRERFKFLKWMCPGALWAVSYYYHSESVSSSDVQGYIERQMRSYGK